MNRTHESNLPVKAHSSSFFEKALLEQANDEEGDEEAKENGDEDNESDSVEQEADSVGNGSDES